MIGATEDAHEPFKIAGYQKFAQSRITTVDVAVSGKNGKTFDVNIDLHALAKMVSNNDKDDKLKGQLIGAFVRRGFTEDEATARAETVIEHCGAELNGYLQAKTWPPKFEIDLVDETKAAVSAPVDGDKLASRAPKKGSATPPPAPTASAVSGPSKAELDGQAKALAKALKSGHPDQVQKLVDKLVKSATDKDSLLAVANAVVKELGADAKSVKERYKNPEHDDVLGARDLKPLRDFVTNTLLHSVHSSKKDHRVDSEAD